MRPLLSGRAEALVAAVLITAGLAVASKVYGAPDPAALADPPTLVESVRAKASPPAGRTQASCRTSIEGSHATASCHNPNPETDRIRLHVECERWWDIDEDGVPADVRPTGYTELAGRCWKGIRAAWVTHERVHR
ncbi:hypothetical protein ACIOJD_12395 [Streptomyces sp. NPDC088116]|uniref:hypothetical protein n=1 Tax=Streptomyces sp. NPDC088116 TaxID=3365825 RepID=UPI00381EFBD3